MPVHGVALDSLRRPWRVVTTRGCYADGAMHCFNETCRVREERGLKHTVSWVQIALPRQGDPGGA
ncbi:hypothetical protein AURDEDRAFT_167751 [Auricularia subglabra TFB-10046 SS5]|nr:hypothetical protein AURDEDRAFT_167751 [Auricularia subglabra TFB-10046 SS5]